METRHDPNGPLPHNFPTDVPRIAWRGIHSIAQQRQPDHDNLVPPPETESREGLRYTLLFELMKSTEKAHNYLTIPGATPPTFGLSGWKMERDLVISEIIESKKIIHRLISPTNSVPIYFEDNTGQMLRGRITALRDFANGCWEFELKHDESPHPITVFKTSDQLRAEHLAATTEQEPLSPENL